MKRRVGNFTVIALVILTVVVWLVFPPKNPGNENIMRAYVGEILVSS